MRAGADSSCAPPWPAAGASTTPTHKQVWFHLDLPDRPVGTRTAGPSLPAHLLPLADGRVRVAVIQIDRVGAISAWNEDAEDLFGYAAEQVIGKPLTDLAASPRTPGASTGIVEALQLSRWEGSYGLRAASGRVTPVYASTSASATRAASPPRSASSYATTNAPCFRPRCGRRPPDRRPAPRARPRTLSRSSSAPPPRTTWTASSSARWSAPATCSTATPPSCSSRPTTTELEVRASTGLPSARQRFARVPVEAGPGRYGSARMPPSTRT